jgi:hypothetical protein
VLETVLAACLPAMLKAGVSAEFATRWVKSALMDFLAPPLEGDVSYSVEALWERVKGAAAAAGIDEGAMRASLASAVALHKTNIVDATLRRLVGDLEVGRVYTVDDLLAIALTKDRNLGGLSEDVARAGLKLLAHHADPKRTSAATALGQASKAAARKKAEDLLRDAE